MNKLRPLDWVFALLIVVLALFAFDIVEVGEEEQPSQQAPSGHPFKLGFARAYDAWTDSLVGPDISIVTWLRDEALLVCNILDSVRRASGVPTPVDPQGFCSAAGGGGTDPTRPPPVPECDWGECPED